MARKKKEQSVLGMIFHSLFAKKSRSLARGHLDREWFATRWQEIGELMKKNDQSNFKAAVLDADKLLDLALRNLNFPGETMGERLKGAKNHFSQIGYNAAWEAHKIRNLVVHEPAYDLLRYNTERAINNYKKALEDIRAL